MRLPPRWFVVAFRHTHRAVVRVTRGRLGLWRPRPGRWGALWLTTTGRRPGRPRRVLVGNLDDGADLTTMAMNGWGAGEPAWWLNLQAHPEATVRTRDGSRPVRAHAARGSERERLWAQWAAIDANLDAGWLIVKGLRSPGPVPPPLVTAPLAGATGRTSSAIRTMLTVV